MIQKYVTQNEQEKPKYKVRVFLRSKTNPALRVTKQEGGIESEALASKMTLKEFGDRFGVAHSTVINWEKKGDQPTKMEWGTEKDIRMEVMHHVYKNPEKIGDLFVELSEKPRAKSAQLEIEDLRAAS